MPNEITPDAVEAAQEWNPLAVLTVETFPLEVSGGRASVSVRRWSGRERLAYEDSLTTRFLATSEDGEDTVKLGTMRLIAVALTVVGSTGFPKRATGGVMLSGEDLDVKRAELLSLDAATYAEIQRRALEVQPLPRAADDDLDDEPDPEDVDEDGEGEEGPDPTRTPPTPADDAPETHPATAGP